MTVKNRLSLSQDERGILSLSRLSADKSLLLMCVTRVVEAIHDGFTDGDDRYAGNLDSLETDLESALELVRTINNIP